MKFSVNPQAFLKWIRELYSRLFVDRHEVSCWLDEDPWGNPRTTMRTVRTPMNRIRDAMGAYLKKCLEPLVLFTIVTSIATSALAVITVASALG